MKLIDFQTITDHVQQLCRTCAFQLPPDVLNAIKNAVENETNHAARDILEKLLENSEIAQSQHIPLCQDTGLAIVFVDQGSQIAVKPPAERPDLTITDAINIGIETAYQNALLRKSVVDEPLNKRKNTGTNTPAVIHYNIVPGDKLKITVMAKGGGCENKSMFKMFNPTDPPEKVQDWIIEVVKNAGANACPPFIVGVGIGGSFEQCSLISKKALLREIASQNSDPFYGKMEKNLLQRINSTNIGPQGLGGDTTALAVHIETAPCHIASLPVAVNIECHSHRHKSVTL